MTNKKRVNNPTGKGGFQERPQDRNKGGAPRKGQSWGERIDTLSGMTRDELIEYVGGAKTFLGKLLKELPPGIPTRDALILISFIQFGREPNAKMLTAWMDRVDGKPQQAIKLGGDGIEPLTIRIIKASDAGNTTKD